MLRGPLLMPRPCRYGLLRRLRPACGGRGVVIVADFLNTRCIYSAAGLHHIACADTPQLGHNGWGQCLNRIGVADSPPYGCGSSADWAHRVGSVCEPHWSDG